MIFRWTSFPSQCANSMDPPVHSWNRIGSHFQHTPTWALLPLPPGCQPPKVIPGRWHPMTNQTSQPIQARSSFHVPGVSKYLGQWGRFHFHSVPFSDGSTSVRLSLAMLLGDFLDDKALLRIADLTPQSTTPSGQSLEGWSRSRFAGLSYERGSTK